MPTSEEYRVNNYYLEEIFENAKALHVRKINPEILFQDVNSLKVPILQALSLQYAKNDGPVNSLRKEIADDLLAKKQISAAYIDSRITIIEKDSGKRNFKSYDHFSILFPFFREGISFNVKEAINEFLQYIVYQMGIGEIANTHAVDFLGSRGFGGERVWGAIYNNSHRNHQTAKQLFFNLNFEGLWCGLYDRLEQSFIDGTFIPIDKNTLSVVVDFFQGFNKEIQSDKYSDARFFSIGTKGTKFFKLSHGTEYFREEKEIQFCVDNEIAVMHEETKGIGKQSFTQYDAFREAKSGDFFYCCWGNRQLLFIGQFIDEKINDYSFTKKGEGWKERRYRLIQQVQQKESYQGAQKWWTPNYTSTFIEVPKGEYEELNTLLLRPYFQSEIDDDKQLILPDPEEGPATRGEIEMADEDVDPKLDVLVVASEFGNFIRNLDKNRGQMLGVFGRWGRGKTYFVEQLKNQLRSKEETKLNSLEAPTKKLEKNPHFTHITFNAWKYQETEAIWAYLYEVILETYLTEGFEPPNKSKKSLKEDFEKKEDARKQESSAKKEDSWHLRLRKKTTRMLRTFTLNTKRKGVFRIIAILVGFLASLYVTYGISNTYKTGITGYLMTSVGILGLFQAYRIYKKYYQGIKDLMIEYSTEHNYKAVLGLQAEIQSELIVLLQHWFQKEKDKKVLLFVDDLDRCSEEKIIQIIDALRVLLDDDYLIQKLIILVAVDERLLQEAIRHKYRDFSEKPSSKKKFEKTEKERIREYMDKLFIAGIKLPALNINEQAIILQNYAARIGLVKENKTDLTDKIVTPNKQKQGDADTGGIQFPDPDLHIPKYQESEMILMPFELEMLQENASSISEDVTPRGLRIYIYRYLLSKNLIGAYMVNNVDYKLRNEVCSVLAKAIAHKSFGDGFIVTEMEEIKALDNQRIKEFLPKLIDIVVPY